MIKVLFRRACYKNKSTLLYKLHSINSVSLQKFGESLLGELHSTDPKDPLPSSLQPSVQVEAQLRPFKLLSLHTRAPFVRLSSTFSTPTQAAAGARDPVEPDAVGMEVASPGAEGGGGGDRGEGLWRAAAGHLTHVRRRPRVVSQLGGGGGEDEPTRRRAHPGQEPPTPWLQMPPSSPAVDSSSSWPSSRRASRTTPPPAGTARQCRCCGGARGAAAGPGGAAGLDSRGGPLRVARRHLLPPPLARSGRPPASTSPPTRSAAASPWRSARSPASSPLTSLSERAHT
jgi:hypothetical protein